MTRMLPTERKRFNNLILSNEIRGWTFEVFTQKNHDCCVVCVVRKGDYIAREYRYPTQFLLNMAATWYKGIDWLEKEMMNEVHHNSN